MKPRLLIVAVIVFLLSLMDLDGSSLMQSELNKNSSVEVLSSSRDESVVVRVIDGDTIELQNGSKVRYIGIDTPETNHPQKTVECFGVEAKEYNSDLILGKRVYLERDITDKDRYGRLLRYVYVVGENGEELFVNNDLVEKGYAVSISYPPDIRFQETFLNSERKARMNNSGLWDKCYTE